MLRFNKILDVTTGTRYTIQRVTVMDAGTDERPEGTFEVDLLSEDDEILCDVVVCTSGDGSVCINRNLGRDDSTDTVKGIVEGKTLIVTTGPGMLDEEGERNFRVVWCDHEGNEQERWFKTLRDAIYEEIDLNGKFDGVQVFDADGNPV